MGLLVTCAGNQDVQKVTHTMIIYSKTLWGLPLLSRVYGSALPRALAPALLSGLVTLVLLLASSSTDINQLWAHPFAYQPFAFIVSFVLAFRCDSWKCTQHWHGRINHPSYLQHALALSAMALAACTLHTTTYQIYCAKVCILHARPGGVQWCCCSTSK